MRAPGALRISPLLCSAERSLRPGRGSTTPLGQGVQVLTPSRGKPSIRPCDRRIWPLVQLRPGESHSKASEGDPGPLLFQGREVRISRSMERRADVHGLFTLAVQDAGKRACCVSARS
jgi:hypothetical protein